MEYLLNISSDYWENFINIDDDALYMRDVITPKTPEKTGGSVRICMRF